MGLPIPLLPLPKYVCMYITKVLALWKAEAWAAGLSTGALFVALVADEALKLSPPRRRLGTREMEGWVKQQMSLSTISIHTQCSYKVHSGSKESGQRCWCWQGGLMLTTWGPMRAGCVAR